MSIKNAVRRIMHNNRVNKKVWLSKNDILEIYPMGIKTYQNRIKKLQDETYKNYTHFEQKALPNSNLKSTKYRVIHKDIIDEIFGGIRNPKIEDTIKVIKWVKLQQWKWFCNIIPTYTMPDGLIGKIEYFHKELKKNFPKDNQPVIFLSVEYNTQDKFYHLHFLINYKGYKDKNNKRISAAYLERLLSEVSCPNTKKERRIYIKPYRNDIYGNKGSSYSAKVMKIEYGILNRHAFLFKPITK